MPKMKAYASFDLYLADQPAKNRALIRALRAFVGRVEPGLVEGVKWGNGCWLADGGPVAYVYSDVDHVQFGFVRGSSLADPERRLLGQGQYVRHVKLRAAGDLDERAFSAWLREAVRLGPVRLGKRTKKAPRRKDRTPERPARKA
jgi:hypothetical protein